MAPLTFPAPTTLTSPATSSSLSPRASRAVAVRSRVPSAARATTRTPTLTPTPTLLAAVAATVTTTTQPPALESTAPSSAWLLLVVSLLFCKRTARSRCCPLAAWDGDKRRVWGFPGLGGPTVASITTNRTQSPCHGSVFSLFRGEEFICTTLLLSFPH